MKKKLFDYCFNSIVSLNSKTYNRFVSIGKAYENVFASKAHYLSIKRPIFIIGSPRSGTTIFYKLFRKHPDLAYLTQLSDLFYDAPYFANRVLYDYAANHGSRLLLQKNDKYLTQWKHHDIDYTEAPRVWWRFHPKSQNDYLNSTDLRKEEKEFYRLYVQKHLLLYKKERFVSKKPSNSLRILYLNEIFPDAIFIHILRDGRAVAASLLERKKKFGKNFGASPPEIENVNTRDLISLCGLQWQGIIRSVFEDSAKLKPDQFLTIKYEDFIDNWKEILLSAFQFCDLDPDLYSADPAVRIKSHNLGKWMLLTDNEKDQLHTTIREMMIKCDYEYE